MLFRIRGVRRNFAAENYITSCMSLSLSLSYLLPELRGLTSIPPKNNGGMGCQGYSRAVISEQLQWLQKFCWKISNNIAMAGRSGADKLTRSSLKGVQKRALFACKNGGFASSFLLSGLGLVYETIASEKRQICLSKVPFQNPFKPDWVSFCIPKKLSTTQKSSLFKWGWKGFCIFEKGFWICHCKLSMLLPSEKRK